MCCVGHTNELINYHLDIYTQHRDTKISGLCLMSPVMQMISHGHHIFLLKRVILNKGITSLPKNINSVFVKNHQDYCLSQSLLCDVNWFTNTVKIVYIENTQQKPFSGTSTIKTTLANNVSPLFKIRIIKRICTWSTSCLKGDWYPAFYS